MGNTRQERVKIVIGREWDGTAGSWQVVLRHYHSFLFYFASSFHLHLHHGIYTLVLHSTDEQDHDVGVHTLERKSSRRYRLFFPFLCYSHS
jgi:hypothetical protein